MTQSLLSPIHAFHCFQGELCWKRNACLNQQNTVNPFMCRIPELLLARSRKLNLTKLSINLTRQLNNPINSGSKHCVTGDVEADGESPLMYFQEIGLMKSWQYKLEGALETEALQHLSARVLLLKILVTVQTWGCHLSARVCVTTLYLQSQYCCYRRRTGTTSRF